MEGPSDEAALGTIMKEYFSSEEVQFVVVHGDITLKDYVSVDTILAKINEQIADIKTKYRYEFDDFIKIIHIVDMDGVYISDENILETGKKSTLYYIDRIETNSKKNIIQRNQQKREILFKLRKTGKIHDIPYKIYYNSCNLEHVLYGELRAYSDDEKERLSDDFAERYEGKAEEFVAFISSECVAVQGNYQKTWKYIEKGNNSLHRGSNMHLMFDES